MSFLTIKMRVLSFDVGTKNLAFCDMSVNSDSFTVHAWKVESCVPTGLNVNDTQVSELVPYFTTLVLENLESWSAVDYDYVLIENQPMGGRGTARNLKTKVLSHILQSHLLKKKNVKVQFVHPGLKLKDMPKNDEGKSTYRDNKKFAVEKTLELVSLDKCTTSEECVKIMKNKHNKKDDLADSFLQAKYFIDLVLAGDLKLEKSEPVLKKKRSSKPKVEVSEIIDVNVSEANAEAKTEAKAGAKTEAKAEVKTEAKAEAKAEPTDLEKVESTKTGKKRGRTSK